MNSFIVREVVAPIATRLGTALTAYLVGRYGFPADLANEVGLAISAVALLGADWLSSYVAGLKRDRATLRAAGVPSFAETYENLGRD